ncbi:MAG: 4Fe-4S binding protein [Geobacteraceae bacterium]|nr:4Fe-4S binding protein [Geobacteraceae bacterium]
MNISRKDFFRKSLLSLGEAVCSVSNALKSAGDSAAEVQDVPDAADFVATPGENRMAIARNDYCLAKNSGCFACVERCESQAIRLVPGVGVRINAQLCNGCGTCEYVCPVTPKAITMQTRDNQQSISAKSAEILPERGDTTC